MKTSIATSLVVLLAATGAVGQPRPPTARPTAVDGTTDTLPDAGPPTPEPTATDGQPAAQQNLFAGFNTELLENGLRVWYQHIPGAANTSVGLSVPYGWDMDPLGKEETAHFLEHMLFGDHRGLTELEIKEQVDSLGGSRNGFTSPDRTFYYVTLPAEFGLLGVEWLARIVEPHDMVPAVVERNRQPVALEIRARPRELFDHLAALVVPWFTLPGFWEREFGIETRQRRRYDRFESLHAITPQDLRDFYDRYYAPEAMTLVIAGDLPNDAALPLVRETFGRLPTRSAPTAYGRVVDPGRPYQRVTWQFRPNVRYRRYFKIYDQTRDTRIRLLFLGRYLQRRLNARLRFGDTKAVYGIRANAVARGPALSFQIEAPINQEHWAFAREVIDEELEAVRTASTPSAEFETDRQAVVEQLIAQNREAEDLVMWVYRAFYEPAVFEHFPDLPSEFAAMEQADLAAFVREAFRADREVRYLDYPQPLTQGVLAVLALVLGTMVIKGTRRVLTRRIEMRNIRYVARLRLSIPTLILGGLLYAGAGIAIARLLIFVAMRLLTSGVSPVESYVLQTGAYVLIGAIALVLVMIYASLPPRKLLVFTDRLLVKSAVCRSRDIPLDQIVSVGLRRITDVARRGQLGSTLPLSLGVGSPAVHIDVRGGHGYLVRVRDAGELLGVLAELGVTVERPERSAGAAIAPA